MDEQSLAELKQKWPTGARVRFTGRDYDFGNTIPTGAAGKVQFVDDAGAVHIHWETGFDKALIPGYDEFRREEATQSERRGE